MRRQGRWYDLRRSCGDISSLSPDKLNQLFLKVATQGYDVVQVVGPENENSLVSLRVDQKSMITQWEVELATKAPHCSFSARGTMAMEATI
jgi:hypothetical protein